ncbi:hypothetical protein HPB52_018143 [Rhipicephalus sanguineus]|uniref:Endonuclease/exonuclease/phosphatase domain-containing protein n=1 Tax=Rhipicephalus sanguineus TaxID=34632 RepID=A0A9D4SZE1_RHISA|nr:hypothetical protein HPB52_018143 [Rhipicephalus sanguineus]
MRTQGVDVLQTRMLGDMKTAVITFHGELVPRFVYYRGGKFPRYPYKNTMQVCKVCYHAGHRSDVYPPPDSPVCRICCHARSCSQSRMLAQVCDLRRRPPHGRSQLQEEAETTATQTLQNFEHVNLAPGRLTWRSRFDNDSEAEADAAGIATIHQVDTLRNARSHDRLIFLGDFNAHHTTWG